MENRRLKKWVKSVLVILLLISLVTINKKLDDSFMKSCAEAGHSKTYCEKGR